MCVGFLAKIILFLISLVIFLLGIAFIVIGSLLLGYPNYLGNLLEQLLSASGGDFKATDVFPVYELNDLTAGITLGVGVALFLIGLLGFLAINGRKCFTYLYLLVLNLLTFAEIGATIYLTTPPAVTMINNKFGELMFSSLKINFVPESFNSAGVIVITNDTSTSWIYLQNKYQCCGSNGFNDYSLFDWNQDINVSSTVIYATVPPSCCQMKNQTMSLALQSSDYSDLNTCLSSAPLYADIKGCAKEILNAISETAKVGILVLTSAAAIQLFCMTISIIIYQSGYNGNSKTSAVI